MSPLQLLVHRPRRLRRTPALRQLVRENKVDLRDLIQPLFIDEGISEARPIETMPGILRLPESAVCSEVEELYRLGIRYVMPFGISHHKDEEGSDTWSDEGLLRKV